MITLPPLPNASAYIWTNGCGASRAKSVSRSGVQNRKRMVVANPSTPVAITLVIMPRPATTLLKCQLYALCDLPYITPHLAFFVSSAIWPDASKPIMVPAVNRLTIR